MGQYSLQGDTYVIEGYDKLPAFSSFLPGLAGVRGIPLWVFYTNRGQGINSFGIHNKDNAILEFNPANTAYENTALKGFRTFVKSNGKYFEPYFTLDQSAARNMYIRRNDIAVEEINKRHGLKITVKYFVMPEADYGALVRRVCIKNISGEVRAVDVLDGLPKIIPYGIKNSQYKEMSNLLQSWTEIKNIDRSVPFYTLRASSDDSAEVSGIEGGYFYLTVQDNRVMPVIYDPEVIFEYDSSLVNPIGFMETAFPELLRKPMYYANKIPCGFTPFHAVLPAGGELRFDTLTGFAGTPDEINDKLGAICTEGYLSAKEKRAGDIGASAVEDIRTHTASPVFDRYLEQCYLDNFLRGGYPFVFNQEGNRSVIHLFSRKHGDPERDYNFFSIAGEYYSQGNGNYRDVCQNRRNDVFFNKDVGDFNIRTFLNLIQMDGYNPLEVRPSTFMVKSCLTAEVDRLLKERLGADTGQLKDIISKPFTPGLISNYIARHHIGLSCDEDSFIAMLLGYCTQNIEAGHKEGYWSDHWDYILDLIEGYLKIYPDKKTDLLFGDPSYRYYDSPARVLPRSEKYVLYGNEARQFGAVVADDEKLERGDFNRDGTNWLKSRSGKPFETILMVKLISLALVKFTSLDPYGMGIEMEGGKPGWNDAMNGLPGLFGSGMPETFELKRLIAFICASVALEADIRMPVVMLEFLDKVTDAVLRSKAEQWEDFSYWDKVTALREEYREATRFYMDETLRTAETKQLLKAFQVFSLKLEEGIHRAEQYGKGLVPTYFTFRAARFETVKDANGQPVISHYGLPKVRVKAFEARPLPAFLEGPARKLAAGLDVKAAGTLSVNVRNSDLYDRKLSMYKTSVPIEELSSEHGRIRAFTPGWLERESIFLHMEYKYLLAMLKAGLYDTFYEDIQSVLIPFLEPERYGRSILENSSFLVSGANPNTGLHGRGYVARLSGSTTEMISMWIEMFVGGRIFSCDNGVLCLHFEPKLPGWFFDGNGEVSFRLMSHCEVTYQNPKRKNTFGQDAARITGIVIHDTKEEIEGNVLAGKLAEDVREGIIRSLTIHMK